MNSPICPSCGTTTRSGAKFCSNCGTALAGGQPSGLQQGVVLDNGRYQIVRRLGKGGFGAVYLASDLRLKRECVVKQMLLPDRSLYPTTAAWQSEVKVLQSNFEREARSLIALNAPGHPNIPEIYDFFDDVSGNYLVMKYIKGENLAEQMTRLAQPLPWREAVEMTMQVASALDYMHSRTDSTGKRTPVLHRDIKPANILVDENKRVWLVDFGLSKVQPASGTRKRTTLAAGTPGYTPLEQWLKQAVPASDVYALGVTLHYLVTGHSPRQLPQLPPIRTLDSTLPVALEKAIAAALRDKPDDRPSIGQWKADLEQLIRRQVGTRPFTWRDGSQSHQPEALPALANRQWEEAKGYLYGDKWLRWFEDFLARNDMAALVRQIITQHKNQDIGLDHFLRTLDPTFPPAKLQTSNSSLDFGIVPWQTQQTGRFEIRNSGSGCLYGEITGLPTWLQVDFTQFATHQRQAITLTADTNALSPRRQAYTATLTIDAGTSGQAQLLVQLTVPEPQLLVEPPQLNLGTSSRGAKLAGTFIVRNSGGSAFEGTAHSDAPWLTVQPASFRGEASQTSYLQIEADTNRMTPAQHTANVRIHAQANNWQQTEERQVTVRLIENLWQRAAPSIKWLAVAVGLILLLIGGGSLVIEWFTGANTPNPTLEGTPVAAISADNAAQVTQQARWGKGRVTYGLVYSPDGKLLAVGTSNGVYLYDTETLEVVRLLNTNNRVDSIASPLAQTARQWLWIGVRACSCGGWLMGN